MTSTVQPGDNTMTPSRPRTVRLAGWWLLVIVAIAVGVLAGAAALLVIVALTGNSVLGGIAGGLALVACTGGLTWLAARAISPKQSLRRWLPVSVTTATLAVIALTLGPVLYGPGLPSTPFPPASDARFWDLPAGSRIAYFHTPARGDPRPEPVILVHGGPGAPDVRDEALAQTLADAGFDVYDYHQIGAGLSDRLPEIREYTVARHVADLEAIRAVIDADRVVLIGGSWGGKLIAQYLAAHPDRVARAVVHSPAPLWSPAFADTNGLTASGRDNQLEVIGKYPSLMLAQALLSTVGPDVAHALFPDHRIDGAFQALIGEIDMWSGCPGRGPAVNTPASDTPANPPAGVGFWANAATSLDAQRVADPRPALREVTTPLLVLRGECDYIAWDVTREYHDVLPNAVLLAIADAGHVIPADQPGRYREAVRAFLLDEPLPQDLYVAADVPW